MSRWTTIFASIAIIAFCLPAVAADSDPPRNIELKPGAASPDAAGQTAADTSSGTTTRQIVTEGKDAPAAEAAPAAPAPAPAEAAPPPAKAETSPPPEPAPAPAPAPPPPPAEAAVPAPPPPPPPGLKPEEVVVAVQAELKRVGCDPGAINGDWGGRSREPLGAFGHFAKDDVGKLRQTRRSLK